METSSGSPTPGEASAAIADAEAGRTALAHHIVVPHGFFLSLGVSIALQIGTTAAGLAAGVTSDELWGWLLLAAGWLAFLAVSAVQLLRFRKQNGVWLGGLASRVVGGTGTAASISYTAALGGATWAAFTDAWWLVPVCSIAGGVAYALSGMAWVRTYRADPAAHGRGESALWLAVLVVLAVSLLVLLVLQS
jgi:hypothetical protein